MKILVTGASGFVGSALVSDLIAVGHRVVRLVRARPKAGEEAVFWDPARKTIDARALEGLDAVVHLAGENLGTGRWTKEKKARIRDSRVAGTRFLCESLARLERLPATLVSASAVGYYGDRGDETLMEDSPPGTGFLAEVCRDWEAAAATAAGLGIRLVTLRLGMVLSPEGGALARLLPVFRAGGGGKLGSGRQYVSWIAMEDLIGAIRYVLARNEISGPVNAVAPNPVTNREFTEALGRALGKSAVMAVPAFALRLALGEMAREMLLASARVVPKRLMAAGYAFRFIRVEDALRALLAGSGKPPHPKI